jgi:glycosyltransferase involved in cell wall biosynthesis
VRILLIGNYLPDAQESMQRYAELMRAGLSDAGHKVALAAPQKVLNKSGRSPAGIWKWVGYLDKYVLSPPELACAARRVDIVHVCDHANSMYVPMRTRVPYVVTCHDLLAVRGALGEQTDCPTGFAGRQLQKQILKGLRRAAALACVSGATLRDAERLLAGYSGRLVVAPNALSYPYRTLDRQSVRQRLAAVADLGEHSDFVLHVGSNLRRKNREGALRAASIFAPSWRGKIVFAGQPLTRELRNLAEQLQVSDRVVEVIKPSNELLEALYNGAMALLYPSRFEGFGWPIIEAQACGCPVICSNREPLPEVAGDAAIMLDPDDHIAFAAAVVGLAHNAHVHEDLRRRGLENARRYDRAQMIARFLLLYEQLAVAA